MKRPSAPQIRVHVPSDRYYVRLAYEGGRREMVYLGAVGSSLSAEERTRLANEARKKYDAVVSRYLSGFRQSPEESEESRKPVVGELVLAYLDWLKKTDTSEGGAKYGLYRLILRPLLELFAELPIDEFRVRHLIAVRDKMIRETGTLVVADPEEYQKAKKIKKTNEYRRQNNLPLLPEIEVQMVRRPPSRTTINGRISQIRTVFRKGIAFGLVPEAKISQLMLLDNLVAGEAETLEPITVKPVPMPDFFATLNEVGPVVRAMLMLQLVTGMRSGELVRMKKRDLRKKENGVWEYEPTRHKTQWIRKGKRIPIGGDVIEELRKLIDFDDIAADEFIFSPKISAILKRKERAEKRKLPPRKSQRKTVPQSSPGECYRVSSYYRAVRRAAERAGVTHWHPHQLRHNAATIIDQHFGKEAVMTVLGHLNEKTSDGYIDYNERKADAVASAILRIVFS